MPLQGNIDPALLSAPWEILEAASLHSNEDVKRCMTADPVTATPTTSIGKLAQMMVDAHIHRVVIVDGAGRPKGIVSSTDILAALAHAAQPPASPVVVAANEGPPKQTR